MRRKGRLWETQQLRRALYEFAHAPEADLARPVKQVEIPPAADRDAQGTQSRTESWRRVESFEDPSAPPKDDPGQ